MAHIAILGAGLIGRLMALALRENHRISLFEQHTLDTANTTGRIAAAMLAPLSESVHGNQDIVQMGQQSLSLWPKLLRALDLDIPVENKGTLVLAHRQDEGDLNQFVRQITAANPEQRHAFRQLDRLGIMALEPELAQGFQRGMYIEHEGHLDNLKLFQLTTEHLLDGQVQVHERVEVGLDTSGKITSAECSQVDWVIDCRGMGARQQLQGDGKHLRGVRGEVIRVKAPDVTLTRQVRLMHPRYPLYIVPKGQGHFVIGATEIESENAKPVTVRSALELLSAAYSVHRGFGEGEILSMQAGLRPTLQDNAPLIIARPGLMQINGLYRHGYLLAPYIVKSALKALKQSGISAGSTLTEILSFADITTHKPVVQFDD